MPTLASPLLFLSLISTLVHATPADPIVGSLRNVAMAHARSILAAAKAMPADRYRFSPTSQQRTFAQLVIHIESDSRITCAAIAGTKPAMAPRLAVSDGKDHLVDAPQSSLDSCDSALAKVTDASLADSVTYYDQPGLRVQALVGIVDDWADHYAQQAIYLRLNGILPPTAKPAAAAPTRDSVTVARDGQRDFDFEIGSWSIQMKRLVHPLSGSKEWVSPEGYKHLVQKVWDGRASLAQLENDRPARHFDGLMLRTYNPETHEWSIYWASSKSGTLDTPIVGHFDGGRGEFFQHDMYQGKPILVRLVYSDITPTSFRTESSYSADEGKSWEPNLIQSFTRIGN